MDQEPAYLTPADAASLVVGRLILAWGHLDNTLEFHLHQLTSLAAQKRLYHQNDYSLVGRKVHEARFTQRLGEFRRALVVADAPAAMLTEYDGLRRAILAHEPTRAAFAHGSCELRVEGDKIVIDATFYKSDKPAPADPTTFFRRASVQTVRAADISSALDAALGAAKAVSRMYYALVGSFAKSTLASHAQNSAVPTISDQPGSSKSSPPSNADK